VQVQGAAVEVDGGQAAAAGDVGGLDRAAIDVQASLDGARSAGTRPGGQCQVAHHRQGPAVDVDGAIGDAIGTAGIQETDRQRIGVDGAFVKGQDARAGGCVIGAFAAAAHAQIIDQGIDGSAAEIVGVGDGSAFAGRIVAHDIHAHGTGRAVGAVDINR